MKKKKNDGKFTAKTVKQIHKRDKGRCARCTKWHDLSSGRGDTWSMHHRKPRGSGGHDPKGLWAPDVSNGIILCGHGTDGCHAAVEGTLDESRENGLSVSLNGKMMPWEQPIKHAVHGWVLLNQDGTTEKVGK